MTWRKLLLMGLVILGVVLVYPVGPVRAFLALELPHEVLGATVLIGVAGIAVLVTGWQLSRRLGHDPVAAGQPPV
jgi:hypothetical protein